jgi:hypothetical protein
MCHDFPQRRLAEGSYTFERDSESNFIRQEYHKFSAYTMSTHAKPVIMVLDRDSVEVEVRPLYSR